MSAPPLLRLMDGKRVRARRAPKIRPREIGLQIAVANLLRDHCLPDWIWWHTPNGGRRNPREAATLKRCGVIPGIPDFTIVSPYGSVRYLELKRQGETLSDAQDEFRIFCIKHGIPHSIAFTIDDVLKVFDHWGCLRIALPKIGSEQ
jgi:hypothetical protein